jgi:hypothetical protein
MLQAVARFALQPIEPRSSVVKPSYAAILIWLPRFPLCCTLTIIVLIKPRLHIFWRPRLESWIVFTYTSITFEVKFCRVRFRCTTEKITDVGSSDFIDSLWFC